jgi:L-glyceraldehyde 3-phosphate reductase
VGQLEDNLAAVQNLTFTASELAAIEQYAVDAGINLWRPSSAV